MTDADLARQEWLDERAAVLWIENGWVYGTALLEAHRMWEAKVRRENASGSYGDAPGAIAGGADRAEAG